MTKLTIKARSNGRLKTIAEVQFLTDRIAECEEADKTALRDIFAKIIKLHGENIKVIRVDEEAKKEENAPLNEIRRHAIIVWKEAYKQYGFGDYEIGVKDTRITHEQCLMCLDVSKLRKYMECKEWYAKEKLLHRYVSTDVQNLLSQKDSKGATSQDFPNTWDSAYYSGLKSPEKRIAYERHLLSLGYQRKRAESGQTYYVKPSTPHNQ